MILYILIACLTIAVVGKWVLITLIFPFQVMAIGWERERSLKNKIFAIPYKLWNKYLFRGGWSRYMIHNVAYIPSHHLRRCIYKWIGVQMGKGNVIYYGTEIRQPLNIKIGDCNSLGDNLILDGRRGIEIGNNVNISSNVSIWTLQHDYRDPAFKCKPEGGKVTIYDRVWIGCNVIVLPGVTIGEGAVCCAGCIVTKDVDPYSVVAGIPAKKVNERPKKLKYVLSDKDACRLL